MDLDDRAARAAAALRQQVEPTIDLGRARGAVADTGRRRAHVRRARVTASTFAVLAVLGLLAVAGGTGAGGGDGRLRTDGLDGDERDSGDRARAAAIIGALPAGPMDGKESWRLPVVAEPQSELADGDTITIYGRGFEPDESLGIVQCASEADTDAAGVGGCQLSTDDDGDGEPDSTYGAVTYANADEDGSVVADVEVRRWVTTPTGRVDCFSLAERCLVGVGAISNYDRSGGTYIDFADAPDFEQPTLAVTPAGAVTPGQAVVAELRGWVPKRSVRFSQCLGDVCQALADAPTDETGAVDQQLVLQPTLLDDEGRFVADCEDRCVLRAEGIGPKPTDGATASHAPFPDDVPLAFTSAEPSLATTTTTAPILSDTPAPTDGTEPDEPGVAPTTAPPSPAGPTTTAAPPSTSEPAGPVTTTSAAPPPGS